MKHILAALAVIGTASHGAAGTFFDGEFVNTDWTTVSVVGPPGGQTATQVTSGGNPGAFRSVTTVVTGTAYTAHVRDAWTYDTSQGALQAIAYTIDIRNIFAFGDGHAYGLMVLQGGVYYKADYQVTGSQNFEWRTHSHAGLVNTDFTRIDLGAGNPSFNTGTLTFGFFTLNDEGQNINVGYDNLGITFVPEPSSIVAIGLGIACFALRRRR